MDGHLYAVERYGSRRSEPAAMPRLPRLPLASPARLVGVIELTDDEVGLALVEGPDPESVRASMTAAGWRVDRITAAAWIDPRAGDPGDEPAGAGPDIADGSGR